MTLPSFLLVGPLKTGTTSLWETLRKHPALKSAFVKKELKHFNSQNFQDWDLQLYSDLFPEVSPGVQTFEASPHYFASAKARARIALLLPDVKIVVTLREPVARALSNIFVHRASNLISQDPRKCEAYLNLKPFLKEPGRSIWNGEARKEDAIFEDFFERGIELQQFDYFSQGEYIRHLKCWFDCFPEARIKVIFFEELIANPEVELAKLYDFLEVPPASQPLLHENNRTDLLHILALDNSTIPFRDEDVERLRLYYQPFDAALAEYLQRPLPWRDSEKRIENSKAVKKRQKPSFLLVGPRRTGTASLCTMLNQHRDVYLSSKKEVYCFDNDSVSTEGIDAYINLFSPLKESSGKVVFGASPGLFTMSKENMMRLKKLLPEVQIVCTLKNPVEHFLACYRHSYALHRATIDPVFSEKFETLRAKHALPTPDTSDPPVDKTLDEIFACLRKGDDPFEMLSAGLYLPKLKEWVAVFDEYHVFPFVIEDLQSSEFDSYSFLLEFLGLTPQDTDNLYDTRAEELIDLFEEKSTCELTAEQRDWLEDYYRLHNEELFEFLGRPAVW